MFWSRSASGSWYSSVLKMPPILSLAHTLPWTSGLCSGSSTGLTLHVPRLISWSCPSACFSFSVPFLNKLHPTNPDTHGRLSPLSVLPLFFLYPIATHLLCATFQIDPKPEPVWQVHCSTIAQGTFFPAQTSAVAAEASSVYSPHISLQNVKHDL